MIENGTCPACQLCLLCFAAEQERSGSPCFKCHLRSCRQSTNPGHRGHPRTGHGVFRPVRRGDVQRPQRPEDIKEVAQGSVSAEHAATSPATAASPFGAKPRPKPRSKVAGGSSDGRDRAPTLGSWPVSSTVDAGMPKLYPFCSCQLPD